MSEAADYIAELEKEIKWLRNNLQQKESIAFKCGFCSGFEYRCRRQSSSGRLSRYKKLSIKIAQQQLSLIRKQYATNQRRESQNKNRDVSKHKGRSRCGQTPTPGYSHRI